MCIFDLEFLSNAVSLLLCLAVSDSLCLFLCQTVTLTLLLLPVSTPVFVCFCPNLLSQSWELAVMFFIVFRLLILKPRPSVPACPASGVIERLGWGAGGSAGCSGHPELPQCYSCRPASFGGWELGEGKGVTYCLC